MTDAVAASETAFSRLNKSRRKVYGSVVEEEEEKLLTTSDFLDDGPIEAANEKSLFGDGNDMVDNDDDDELSIDFSEKEDEKQPGEAVESTDDQKKDEEEQSSGGDEEAASDEVLNTNESPASENPSDASVDEEAEETDELSTREESIEENEPEESSEASDRSKRVRKPTAPLDATPLVEEKASAPITDDPPSTQATDMLTQTTDEQPEEDALIASVDTLFVHADKETVTVKDIVLALELEFGVKLTKKTKVVVRERLKSLVQGTVEASGAASEQESEEEESEEEENVEESEDEFEQEEEDSSDFEEEVKKPKKPRKKKKAPSTKKATSTTKEPRKLSRRSAASKVKKPSAVRIHAEMLRKKRMDELRVRNEELQVQQNKEDQERAEQIAARFDTNTDELRMKRLEDRLDLLQKLDQKRIQVIAGEDETAKAPIKAEIREVPSAASTSDSESDSDSDMELEIIGGEEPKQLAPLPAKATVVNSVFTKRNAVQSKALSALDRVSSGQVKLEKDSTSGAKKQVSWNETGSKAQASPGKSLSARAALRSTLLSKQRKMGNLWLARELGYKSEQDHLRDCLQVEKQKRVIVIKKEEARLKNNERKQLRERMLLAEDEAVSDTEPEEKEVETSKEATGVVEEEEDEELAMAKAIENEELEEDDSEQSSDTFADSNAAPEDDESLPMEGEESDDDDDEDDKTVAFEAPEGDDMTVGGDGEAPKSISVSLEGSEIQLDTSTLAPPSDTSLPLSAENQEVAETGVAQNEITNAVDEPAEANLDSEPAGETTADSKDDLDEGETEFIEPTAEDSAASNVETQDPVDKGPKKAKNSGWQEMLRKEAEKLKKEKKRKGNGLVEAEADEEEEEDVVAGLEDFGFSMGMKKKDEEDEDDAGDELDEDDLKHVVDDLSDDEGDEDAGEKARKELQKREEKEQHKEMMRRMREGYDGRRGGIAGGGVGARGLHRFDQLVAADNREDAKRLGLLNDDELDSDDEGEENTFDGKDDAAEIDDETALLDKMLKDRFLHRSSVEIEEEFSDDEEIEVDQQGNTGIGNDEDAEEREQELLAKRFAKRARMQRLIETHGEDEEFSQLRLIDEDQSMKKELMSMKDVVGVARRQKSTSSESQGASSSNAGGDSHLVVSLSSNSQGLFGSQTSGSLVLALKASRKRKNKTSFLGGSAANKEKASQVHKNVSLSHVVFSTENSQSRGGASAGASTAMMGKRKRKAVTSSSLWDKVAANSFRMKKKRY